jgi:hypothetical protein
MKTAQTSEIRNTQHRQPSYGGYVPGMVGICKGALNLPFMKNFRNPKANRIFWINSSGQ